ncbi:hypothetical protein MTR_3g462600 [Medicago truncatula]|uniref:Uncharacterized protein n=1 Tax=Medicago truncatula TaxID=3880 RepID=A0A072UXJ9_MEDTR|nr:hypothetical protein MTR_3g462600 [Medicago truncatula]
MKLKMIGNFWSWSKENHGRDVLHALFMLRKVMDVNIFFAGVDVISVTCVGRIGGMDIYAIGGSHHKIS